MSSLVDYLEKKKEITVYAFYEEVPVKTKINLLEIDYETEQIIWSFNKKLELPLTQSKELYFEYEGTIYILHVIIYNQEEMVTTFPSIAVEPKLKRKYIRVHVDENNPIFVEIAGISIIAYDISEKGVGIILDKDIKDFKISEIYDIVLKIDGRDFKVKGEVVYLKEIDKKNIKIGIKFIKTPAALEDKIFKYILEKQKDILKKMSLFRD